jgi:hypothetical protein
MSDSRQAQITYPGPVRSEFEDQKIRGRATSVETLADKSATTRRTRVSTAGESR